MKLTNFLITLFGLEDPERERELLREKEKEQEAKIAQEKRAEKAAAKRRESEKAHQEKKDKEARLAIAKDVAGFIASGELGKFNDYLRAGYPLAPENIRDVFILQREWLDDTSNSNAEIEAFQTHLSEHSTNTIRKLVLSAIQAFNPKIFNFWERKDIPDYKRVAHYEPHEKDHVFQVCSEGLGMAAYFIEHYPHKFKNDRALFNTYQGEKDNLKFAHDQSAHSVAHDWGVSETQRKNFQILITGFKSLEHIFKHNYAHFEKEAFNEKLSSIGKLYKNNDKVQNLTDKLTHNFQFKMEGFKQHSISTKAWEIIEKINQQGQALNAQSDKLGHEDKFQVKNLTHNVLFSVINEYVAILPEHKAQLKNDAGQSVEELFLENLEQIEAKLQGIAMRVAQNQFKDMKATNQYLKAGK